MGHASFGGERRAGRGGESAQTDSRTAEWEADGDRGVES